MNDQEKQLIEGLTNRIRNAPTPQIDPEADTLIRNGIGGRPDALYILTQTVLIQEMALNQTKSQLDELKKHAAANTAPSTAASAKPSAPSPAPAPQVSTIAPQSALPSPPQGGGFSGFLRSAATTAAGVIAGEAAFSALSGLFGHGSAGGGFLGSSSGVSPTSETIINNYYGDERGSQSESAAGDGAADAASTESDKDLDDASAAEQASASDDSYNDSAENDDSTRDGDSAEDDDPQYDDGGDEGDSYDGGGDDSSDV